MIVRQWLAIGKRGITKVTKAKPQLGGGEIACEIVMKVPDSLFVRPEIKASIDIKDIPSDAYIVPQVIIDMKDMIEQQTGAKIEFTIVKPE